MEKSRKPKIRFKGFTDDWEQRKLGDIMNIASVKRIHQSDWTDSGIRFLRARDIVSASKNEEPDDYLYISKEKYDEYSLVSGKVAIGDLLVTGVGTIGVPYLIRNSEPIYFKDGNIIWFQNGTKIDGDFFLYSFFGKTIQDFINESAGTGTVGTYTIESGKKTPISLPEMKEQQLIGTYFRNLDNLITLHQRKLEKLMNVKKSMLEKMFPKQGSTVPEIRFNGFTQAWEQRKLSGILCEKNERTSDFNSFPLYSLTIENGITPKTDRYERSSLVTKTEDLFKIVNQNEFVTNPMNLRFGALGYNKNPHYISVSGYYDVFSIDNDKCSAFWNSYFKTVSVMTVFDNAATGSLIEKRRVKYSTLKQISLLMPIELREKQKIGSFFEDIDELITLHQRKLEKLKNIKKSMLEKMFI